VHLCGTITSDLTLQKNGTALNVITIDGTDTDGTKATYSGSFNTANTSWWKIQNVTWANGSTKNLISIIGGANGIFTGNNATNVTGGVWIAQGAADANNKSTLPNNILISNNYISSTAADLGSNVQYDIITTEGSRNVVIEGNYLEMRVGGVGGGVSHNDVIQTYQSGSTASGGNPSDWTIRNNWIVMNSAAANDRSWTMLENLSGTNNIYGNIFLGLQGAGAGNGLNINSSVTGAVFNVFNNTFVAKNGASNNVLNLSTPGTINLKNNIFYTGGQTILTGNLAPVRSNNIWIGTNAPSCGAEVGCIRNPADIKFVDYANNNFALKSDSPAVNVAADLGSTFATYINPNATWPNPSMGARSGTWDIGAYEFDVSAAPKTLTLNITGTGTVAATGLTCTGTTCTGIFNAGAIVTLTATPPNGATITWGGVCSGTATTCPITMDAQHQPAAHSIFVTVAPHQHVLIGQMLAMCFLQHWCAGQHIM